MQEIIIELMNQFGYMSILILIAVENLFPPIPSEVILTFGGFMTTYTEMTVVWVVIFATIGSVIGAIILYTIGYLLNKERLEKILEGKIGHILRLKNTDVEKAFVWLDKIGLKAVFFCRFIPIVRSLISIPAGMIKMDKKRFFLYTTLGSLIWNLVLVVLGVVAGNSWEKIAGFLDSYAKITLLTIVTIVIITIAILYKKIKKKKQNI